VTRFDDAMTPEKIAAVRALTLAWGREEFGEERDMILTAVEVVLAAVRPLSWLAPNHRLLETCPDCGEKGLAQISLIDLTYTFEVCECGTPAYPHMVEQLRHRRPAACLAKRAEL
jgi:hypothetical protein